MIENYNNLSYNTDFKMKIVSDFGFKLNPHSFILDFGCGSGKYVQEHHEHGYQAFGCDIKMKDEENADTRSMLESNLLRSIDQKY
jgi:hypothetical protein